MEVTLARLPRKGTFHLLIAFQRAQTSHFLRYLIEFIAWLQNKFDPALTNLYRKTKMMIQISLRCLGRKLYIDHKTSMSKGQKVLIGIGSIASRLNETQNVHHLKYQCISDGIYLSFCFTMSTDMILLQILVVRNE